MAACSSKSFQPKGELSPFVSEEDDLLFSQDYTCSHCRISFVKPEPRHFSFNNPDGMCESCRGLGTQMGDPAEVDYPR